MLSDATESNTGRNKLSLQATTSSGISHFRKTHLERREVVMEEKEGREARHRKVGISFDLSISKNHLYEITLTIN